jgi:hypothetical protein
MIEGSTGAVQRAAAEAVRDGEIARLQRINDSLADALREIHAELVKTGDPTADGWDQKAAFAVGFCRNHARAYLDRHGLLRPQDRPEMVPDVWMGTDEQESGS